jgi:ribose transport system permease protein
MMSKVNETNSAVNDIKAERKAGIRRLLSNSITLLGLIFLVVFFGIVTKGNLLSAKNLSLIFKQGYALLLVTLAGVFVMSTGNLDFSLGATVGFSCVCATLTATYTSPALSIPVAVLVGLAVGLINGISITKFKLPSFIACLCMLFILTAATQSLITGSSIMMPVSMIKWETNLLKGIVAVIYLAVMIVMFNYTKVGKQLKSLGVSIEAARQSGVNIDRMMILAYVISGVAAGIAGFFMMLRTGGAATTTGQTMTTDVIVAIVFGGMSISGGASSKISAAILGTLIVTILNNGMVLAGYGGDAQQLVKGILFLAIIAVSMKRDSNVIVK